MNDIFFKIFPFLRRYMSERTSLFFSGFGVLALIFGGLWRSFIDISVLSSNIFYYCFLLALFFIPISFIASWFFDLKHKINMRIVAIVHEDGNPFPQHATYAKKLGLKFRRPTKEELRKWGLQQPLKDRIKGLLFVTQGNLKNKKIIESLYDPNGGLEDFSIEEYKKIRNEKIHPPGGIS